MRKAYLSVSYSNRQHLRPEITAIGEVLQNHGISLLVFVDRYQFSCSQEKEMMLQAFSDIDDADMLIAEVSDKAIGVGIEIGYAVARRKPVIYLRNVQAEHSTTTAGSVHHMVFYSNISDLIYGLDQVLKTALPGRE